VKPLLRFPKEELYNFAVEAFSKVGVPKEDAKIVADSLVTANLRGVDSHGIIRVPYYIDGLKKGLLSPKTEIKVIKESPISALLDGNKGFCIVAGYKAMEIAIKKAKNSGVGLVGIRNLGHIGMLSYYTEKIAKEKLIGFACANALARVAPFGGAERIFGTNPLSYAFPVDTGKPIIFDIATSATAGFKLRLAALKGEKIPEGIALDKNGQPTTDPAKAFPDGVLLPFGGHKGYGLSLLVELLTSVLIGGIPSTDIPNHVVVQGGVFMMALDPTLFGGYREYSRDVMKLINKIKSCKPAKGFKEVLLPGEMEYRNEEERIKNGIPLDESTIRELKKVAMELGIEMPKPISSD